MYDSQSNWLCLCFSKHENMWYVRSGNFIKGIKPLYHHFNLIAVYKISLALNLKVVNIKSDKIFFTSCVLQKVT